MRQNKVGYIDCAVLGSLFFLLAALPIFSMTSNVFAGDRPQELEGIGITEHLGDVVTIQNLSFLDEKGTPVVLSQYFGKGRPVILALIYFECPKLCNLVLNGLVDAMNKMDWKVGSQFDLVAVSIDPTETPKLASIKKANYLKQYQPRGTEPGWHFLTGKEDQIRTLASQVGFKYRYDEKDKQYLHSATLFVLTPEGKISRYLYGISFKPQNLRMALVEASNGKIGTVMDRVLLFCFHFDPARNSYTLRMWRIVQFVLTLQVVLLVGGLYILWRKDKTRAA